MAGEPGGRKEAVKPPTPQIWGCGGQPPQDLRVAYASRIAQAFLRPHADPRPRRPSSHPPCGEKALHHAPLRLCPHDDSHPTGTAWPRRRLRPAPERQGHRPDAGAGICVHPWGQRRGRLPGRPGLPAAPSQPRTRRTRTAARQRPRPAPRRRRLRHLGHPHAADPSNLRPRRPPACPEPGVGDVGRRRLVGDAVAEPQRYRPRPRATPASHRGGPRTCDRFDRRGGCTPQPPGPRRPPRPHRLPAGRPADRRGAAPRLCVVGHGPAAELNCDLNCDPGSSDGPSNGSNPQPVARRLNLHPPGARPRGRVAFLATPSSQECLL